MKFINITDLDGDHHVINTKYIIDVTTETYPSWADNEGDYTQLRYKINGVQSTSLKIPLTLEEAFELIK